MESVLGTVAPVTRHVSLQAGCVLLGVLAAGCGYTSEEWQAQIDKSTRLDATLRSTESKLSEAQAQVEQAHKRLADQTRLLDAAGLDAARLRELVRQGVSAEERELAVVELRARTQKLELARARFDLLRVKLAELALPGAAVGVSHNRISITLAGDSVFEKAGKRLSKGGKDALTKVASLLQSDPSLSSRDYELTAHTDAKSTGKGAAREALDTSTAQARESLLFLVEKGGLSAMRLHATGRGDTEPVAPSETDDGRQKNRRLELAMVPSDDERLDLAPLTH